MSRGKNVPDGTKRVAQNGYHYIKVDGTWRLEHHVIAEESFGRPIGPNERVVFVDGDRDNLEVENIDIREKGRGSLRRRKAQLEARKAEIQAQIDEINNELSKV